MTDNGEYNIRPDLNYPELQREAEIKLFKNVAKEAERLRDYIILSVLSIIMILTCLLVDRHRFEHSIVNKDITAYLGGIGATLSSVFGLMVLIFAAVGIYKCAKRISVLVSVYRTDLKRAQEKLEGCGIYTDIPEKDLKKYNNIFRLAVKSFKNRKKNT